MIENSEWNSIDAFDCFHVLVRDGARDPQRKNRTTDQSARHQKAAKNIIVSGVGDQFDTIGYMF